MPISALPLRSPAVVPEPSVAALLCAGTAAPRTSLEGLAQVPRPRGGETGEVRPRVPLNTRLGQRAVRPSAPPALANCPIPAAVDQALQAVLPGVFEDVAVRPLWAQSLEPLRKGLAVLHDALMVAGEPGDLEPLLTALSDSTRLCDFAAAGTKGSPKEVIGALDAPVGTARAAQGSNRDGIELDDFAAMGSKRPHEVAIGMLEALVSTACAAVGPGRDGAALAALYGHSPALDRGVNALRTAATTQFMLTHEAQRLGLGDVSALPEAAREHVHRDARGLIASEYEIAQTKLQILRTLGPGDGFVPNLSGLRFTPQLAQGLNRVNTQSDQKAGVLIGALLAMERAVAQSAQGRRMHACLAVQLQAKEAESTDVALHVSRRNAARSDAAYLRQRMAALRPPPLSIGFTDDEPPALSKGCSGQQEAEAIFLALARRGLSGTDEVRQGLDALGKALSRLQVAAAEVAAADTAAPTRLQAQTRAVTAERAKVFAAGILHRLAGPAGPQGDGEPPASASSIRAALIGPGAPLEALADPATMSMPLRRELQALSGQYSALGVEFQRLQMRVNHRATAERVIRSFDGFHSPMQLVQKACNTTDKADLPSEDWRQPLMHHMAQVRGRMDALVEARGGLLGPAAASALRDAVRAAALLCLQEGPDIATAARLADADKLGAKTFLDQTLRNWGLSPGVAEPEVEQALAQPLDGARIEQWLSEFGPDPELMQQMAAATGQELARVPPSAGHGLESPALEYLLRDIDKLEVGGSLCWDLSDGVKARLPSIPVFASVGFYPKGRRTQEDGLQVSRDAAGYELMLRHGLSVLLGAHVELKLSLGLPSFLSAYAIASIKASGHRVAGLALRFPDSGQGAQDLRQLLQRLLAKGSINVRDLILAESVVPVVELQEGGTVSAGTKFKQSLAVPGLSFDGSKHSAYFSPKLSANVSATAQQSKESRSNSRQQVHRHENVFSLHLKAHAQVLFPYSTGEMLIDTGLTTTTASKKLIECHVKIETIDVREGGLLTGHTERCAQVPGDSAFKEAMMGHLGGSALRALLMHLRSSGRPEDRALLDRMAMLVRSAHPLQNIRMRWRIAAGPLNAANKLLQKAMALRNHTMGPHPAGSVVPLANKLEEQTQALLAEPASYRLYGLDVHTTKEAAASLGSVPNFFYMQVERGVRSEHVRKTESIVFDPESIDAVYRQSGDTGASMSHMN